MTIMVSPQQQQQEHQRDATLAMTTNTKNGDDVDTIPVVEKHDGDEGQEGQNEKSLQKPESNPDGNAPTEPKDTKTSTPPTPPPSSQTPSTSTSTSTSTPTPKPNPWNKTTTSFQTRTTKSSSKNQPPKQQQPSLAFIMAEQESERLDSERRAANDLLRQKKREEAEAEEEYLTRLAIEASLAESCFVSVERDLDDGMGVARAAAAGVGVASAFGDASNDHDHDDDDDDKGGTRMGQDMNDSGQTLKGGGQWDQSVNGDEDKDLKLAIQLSLAEASFSQSDTNLKSCCNEDGKAPPAKIANNNNNDNEKPAQTHLSAQEEAEIARAIREAEDAEIAASLRLAMQLQSEEHRKNAQEDRQRLLSLHHSKQQRPNGNTSYAAATVRTVHRSEFESLHQNQKRHHQKQHSHSEQHDSRKLWGRDDYEHHQTHFHADISAQTAEDAQDTSSNATTSSRTNASPSAGYRINPSTPSSAWSKLDKHTIVGPNNEIRTKHDVTLKHHSNAERLLGPNDSNHLPSFFDHRDSNQHHRTFNPNHDHNDNPDHANPSHFFDETTPKKLSVSDKAYNDFHQSLHRQQSQQQYHHSKSHRSTVKGVAAHGHGRAETMKHSEKTRAGAMDGNARLIISKAVNSNLISRCNGVVQEGKEAVVYHATGANGGTTTTDNHDHDGWYENDGWDVAIKIFKRIQEFRERGAYVDGDPRYYGRKFQKLGKREQMDAWTEKEFRNLVRASRAGVPVPKPIARKDNVLFMRFLGQDGWPAPRLKEIGLRYKSARWTVLYCQVLVAVRRLYHCARLVHGDLSEYNILVCPDVLVRGGDGEGTGAENGIGENGKDGNKEQSSFKSTSTSTLRAVLIDFGQAVERRHPSARKWLRRDLELLSAFFVKQGIVTLTVDESEAFVLKEFIGPRTTDADYDTDSDDDDTDSDNDNDGDETDTDDDDTQLDENELTIQSNAADMNVDMIDPNADAGIHDLSAAKNSKWRHCIEGWDDAKDLEWLEMKLDEKKKKEGQNSID